MKVLNLKNREDICNILNASLNDYPYSIDNINTFENELCKFVGGNLTKNNIKTKLDNLNSDDFLKNAWKVESITQLLDIYLYIDDNISTSEILKSYIIIDDTIVEKNQKNHCE